MKICFCGGAGEVGASCLLLNIGGKNLVIDAGARMGSGKDYLPDLRMIQENGGADAILISHAHMDHSGSLPILSREYPDAGIFMTHATKDLIRVLLYDSLKIMENREQEIPVFAEVHVRNALSRIVCYSPGYTFYPFRDDLSVTFYQAGHVSGAVSLYVSSPEGSVFYSGDFSLFAQRTVEGAFIPKLRPDLAILESTYGDRLHANRAVEEERLVSQVREIVAAGKKMLIPAFALGRAQEIILILKRAMNKGQLPPFKIYVDGMVKDICRVYQRNPNYLTKSLAKKILKGNDIFFDDNIVAVAGRQEEREKIMSLKEGACIISSSGMLTGGPSQWYAARLAGDEGSFIALTGYQDEESPGRQLLALTEQGEDEERMLKLGELTMPVKCGIGKYGLSAHGDKTEIISLVHALSPRQVFFVHGNSEVVFSLANEVQQEYWGQVFAPANGEMAEIKVRAPRKQVGKGKLETLSRGKMPLLEEMELLWEFVMKHYGVSLGITWEELAYIWSGKREFAEEEWDDFRALVNSSRYFEPERRRPFIFHAVEQPEPAGEKGAGFMEVNSMLALVDSYFPAETGLYKKGAKYEERVALLYFNFPRKAAGYGKKIADFEKETGWKVRINDECNVAAAQNLIGKLIGPDAGKIEKISYFALENMFKVRVKADLPNQEVIKAAFQDTTGIGLSFDRMGEQERGGNIPVKAREYQVEQNEALAVIQKAFEGKPDRLYKKSLKLVNGQPLIELSFISPAVGERYRDLIDDLEARLRWPIRINPVPNQHEILNIGRKLLEEKGITLRKNLAFMPREMEVWAPVKEENASLFVQVREEFMGLTGLKMVFKRKDMGTVLLSWQ